MVDIEKYLKKVGVFESYYFLNKNKRFGEKYKLGVYDSLIFSIKYKKLFI